MEQQNTFGKLTNEDFQLINKALDFFVHSAVRQLEVASKEKQRW